MSELDSARIARAVPLLARGRLRRERIAQLPSDCRPADEVQAYQLQAALNRALSSAGFGALSGHKIGCTTPVMQRFLNIPNPCAGEVFAPTVHHRNAQVPHAQYLHVGIECEIAVLLSADLPVAARGWDRYNVADAVEALTAGIEIVDDRYDNYKSFDTPTLIADNFFNAGVVLGEPRRDWRAIDLTQLVGSTYINGNEVGRGRGADIMGHPFEALAWLANAMNQRDRALRRGEFVMLGSVVETKWVAAGDLVRIEIEQLGEVLCKFSD